MIAKCRVLTAAPRDPSGPPVLQWLKRSYHPASPSMGAVGLNDGTSPATLVQQMSLQPQASEFTLEALAAKSAIPVSPGGVGTQAVEGLWLTSNVNAPLMLANLRESMTMQGTAQYVRSPPKQQGQYPALISSPKLAAAASPKPAKGLARLPVPLYGDTAPVKSAGGASVESASAPSPRQHALGREVRHRAPVKGKNDSLLLRDSVAPGALAWDRSKPAAGKVKAKGAAVAPPLRDRRRKP